MLVFKCIIQEIKNNKKNNNVNTKMHVIYGNTNCMSCLCNIK